MKLNCIITISGRISSGKSYLAQFLHNRYHIPIASFGGYLKYYCQQNELPVERKTLQDIGGDFIKSDPHNFILNVISHSVGSSDKVILEGVRHNSIFREVLNLTDNHLSIFIDADIHTRYKRYVNRNKNSDKVKTFKQFIISDTHPVEMEIESLKPLCNIVLDSTKDYTTELTEFLEKKLSK